MRKQLLVLNFLLGAVALVFAVQIVRLVFASHPLPPPPVASTPAPDDSAKAQVVPGRPPLVTYSVVATKNLFSPSRSEGPTSSTSLLAAAKPLLYGVVIDGTTRFAYIQDPVTKRTSEYKIGDQVAGGTVEQIESDRVVIKRPDGLLEVNLRDSTKPGRVLPAPQPPRAPSTPPFNPAMPSPPGSSGIPGIPGPSPEPEE